MRHGRRKVLNSEHCSVRPWQPLQAALPKHMVPLPVSFSGGTPTSPVVVLLLTDCDAANCPRHGALLVLRRLFVRL